MVEAMLNEYGNPSSPHSMGEKSRKLIDDAREKIARELGCKIGEIIFTSGATEANNLAIRGLAAAYPDQKRIIISPLEHSSINDTCKFLKSKGYEIIEVGIDNNGMVNIDEIAKVIDKKTLLVSVIHAHNELGVIQGIRKIGALCKQKNVPFLTDAVQSFGKERINVREMNVDLLVASSHKIGGPKGCGFLFVKEGLDLKPLIFGGTQESGLRAGTENVPGIVGFAKALECIKKSDKEKIRKLRDYFISELKKIGGKIHGSMENRLYNNIHVSLPCDSELLILQLSERRIMCSSRSACLTKHKKEQKSLKALGLSGKERKRSVRFVLNEFNTKKDIDYVVGEIKSSLKHYR